MVSLKQVQLLEEKVDLVVQRVTKLQYENTALRSRNSELKVQNEQLVRKVADLQESLSLYEMDKDRIEQGVERALQRLNTIENTVLRSSNNEDDAGDAAMRAVDQAFAPSGESLILGDSNSFENNAGSDSVFNEQTSFEFNEENTGDFFSDETKSNDNSVDAASQDNASDGHETESSFNNDTSDDDGENANDMQQFALY